MNQLKKHLADINQSFPPKLVLPLNPRIEVCGLKIDKCKYMDSKKLPLWLVFQNADPQGNDIYVIFKSGDDLRQDMLTLQMIRIMDKVLHYRDSPRLTQTHKHTNSLFKYKK
jgi:phosphatidylinositol-4,5-bisphosphate 3-kinase